MIEPAKKTDMLQIERLIIDANLAEVVEDPFNEFFVKKIKDRIIGCFALEVFGGYSILKHIVVDKPYRKQGIGEQLINEAIVKSKGPIALCTMFYSFRWFRKFGFKTRKRKDLPISLRNYPQFVSKRYKKCAVMVRELQDDHEKKLGLF